MSDGDGNPVRLFMWHVPRAISSCLTKCLSGIEGMEVWFECYTYCSLTGRQYREATGENMPMEYEGNEGKAQLAATLYERIAGCRIEADRITYGSVKGKLEASKSKYILAKEAHLSFPEERCWSYLPQGFKHVFLIRDPYRVLISYRRAIYDHLVSVGLRSGGVDDEKAFDLEKDDPVINANEIYPGIHKVWTYVRANVDPNPIVINTDDLLADPAAVLSKFCKESGLPYSDSLLSWDASPDIINTWKVPSDEVLKSAVAFYKTALYSSKFLPPKPALNPEILSPDVRKLAAEAMPYFQEMIRFKI